MATVSALAQDPRIMRHLSARIGRGHAALDHLDFLKRSIFTDITEVYFYEGTAGDYAKHFERMCGQKLSLSEQQVADLQRQYISEPELVDGKIHRERRPYLDFVSRYLEKVVTNPSVEVDPRLDPREALLFRNPKSLPTHKVLRDCTTGALQKNDWTTLLVIAESGRWVADLGDDPIFREGRKVFLIEASTVALSDWEFRRSRPVNLSIEGMLTIGVPWWEHNQHLTLTIGSDGRLRDGIYFRRRERTARISPIALSEDDDLRELLRMFFLYVARFYEEHSRWSASGHNPAYDANDFWPALRALGVDQSLGEEGTRWMERLEHAWQKYSGHQPPNT